MPLGRRQRVATVGAAAVATALSLAACSSSSSSSTPASGGSSSAASSASSSSSGAALTGTLNGSGSTFQLVYQQTAIASFKTVQSGMTVNYGGGGSGKGRTDLASGVVNFAGSDSPIPAAETANFKGKTVLYFPDPDRPDHGFVQPVRPQQAAPAVGAGDRGHLRGQDHEVERLGDRRGQPRRHPAQQRDHHRRPLRLLRHDPELLPVPRGRPASAWTLGTSSIIKWPATAHAGSGNSGVAQIVKSTPGAIGYVDYATAKASSLTFASIKNKDGNYVAPSVQSASAAASQATVKPDLTFSAVWAPGATSYPITAQSWVLVYQTQPNANDAAMLKAYVGYLLGDGQKLLPQIGYAPLPSNIDQMATAQLSKIGM